MRNDIGKYLSFECEVKEYTQYITDTFDTQKNLKLWGRTAAKKRM